ncbi:MAG: hypothetical protein ACE5PV_26205 [Candidatus Poribacteria bacterium]
MNRKQITFWLVLFWVITTIASAQQATKSDIQVLEAKITSLETTVKEMDKRLTNQIVELDKRLTNRIDELDKRLNFQISILLWAIGGLIAVVLAVIALPQLLGYFQEKRARADFQKEIDELKQLLEQYHQEIETLKSQRIVAPS